MKVFEANQKINIKKPCVLALGNFDGVHLGHRHLLSAAKKQAVSRGIDFGIFTFDVNTKYNTNLLCTKDEKISLFEKCGADFVYFENFENIKSMEPKDFCEYICKNFSCEICFCGDNFTFGKGAQGKSDDLCMYMKKLSKEAKVVPLLTLDGDFVSSTRIRNLLNEGDIQNANKYLGYPFGFSGEVVHGNSIGHTLGFPTVNVKIPDTKPDIKFGVYASKVVFDGKVFSAITNIGIKPTIDEDKKSVVSETYIFDFDLDIYGKEIRVNLYKKIRDEKKFPSLEELKNTIFQNAREAKKYFKERDNETIQ